jgi:hypothetical protein
MERTGGEPDVVGLDKATGELLFVDCSAESPKGRRSICFDDQALQERREHKPADSAASMAKAMGIELLTEEEYRTLQQLGEFDTKTSSWVQTPAVSGTSVAPCSATVATIPFSSTTTAPSRTTRRAASAAACGCEAASPQNH